MAQLINSEEEGVPPSKNAGWVALGLWDRLQCCHGVPATCCLRRLQGRKRDQRSDGLGSLAERNWHVTTASPPLRMVKESAPNSPASGKRVKVSTTELISSTDSVSKATTFG